MNEKAIDESERMWSGRGLLEVVTWSFPEGTKEDHEEPQVAQVGCWPRIEPVPFRIQVYSSTAKPGRLLERWNRETAIERSPVRLSVRVFHVSYVMANHCRVCTSNYKHMLNTMLKQATSTSIKNPSRSTSHHSLLWHCRLLGQSV